MTREQVMESLQKRLKTESRSELAAALKIRKGHLSEILSGKKQLGPKVEKALGLEVVYRRVPKQAAVHEA